MLEYIKNLRQKLQKSQKFQKSQKSKKSYIDILKRALLAVFVLSIGIVSNLSGIAFPPHTEAFASGSDLDHASDSGVLSLSLLSGSGSGSHTRIGKNELRGVWIPTVSNLVFPSRRGLPAEQLKNEIDEIIKTTAEANLNAIFFQVRPTSDALYDSEVFPTSHWLTGAQGDSFADGFDPLSYIIQAAHAHNIELHAWINPYRITSSGTDLNALAPSNPARRNPGWTVAYGNQLWYNPGLPEVRDLVIRGAVELVRNYNIDGIHFDDYFYPYRIDGIDFNDAEAFRLYGAGRSLDDFRRESVNAMVKGVYDAIKSINPEVRFGISPFGIWANQSHHPDGSATAGNNSYSTIYSDSRAWIQGGYIDYIAPQIYWAFSTSIARYDILVRWWSALVDGTGVDLYIGHAAYRLFESDDAARAFQANNGREIPRQIEYARQYMGVAGSIIYDYRAIRANAYNLKDNLAKLFAEPREVLQPWDNGRGIRVRRPWNGNTIATSGANLLGSSNPLFPVYYNGRRVPRTKSGYFSLLVNLQNGRNNIVLSQNNSSMTHVIHRASASAPVEPNFMSGYRLVVQSYAVGSRVAADTVSDIVTTPGSSIIVSVRAPSNSTVTARLGGAVINLEPLDEPHDLEPYMTERYRGTIHLPNTQPDGEMIDLGNIIFTASRDNYSASVTGVNVKLINRSVYPAGRAVEVTRDYAHIKRSPGSSFYGDYLPASVGMRDIATDYRDGHFQLAFGGWVSAADVAMLPVGRKLLSNRILSASMENMGNITEIRFAVTENVPVDARAKDGSFFITLFNCPDGAPNLVLADNPLFRSVRTSFDWRSTTATYTFDLIHADNFYGFEVVYEGGFILIRAKNPMKKTAGDRPLEGLTIVLDAGHGGTDHGALGFVLGGDEKDLTLALALTARDRLTELGAAVIMTRETDITVDIYRRMQMLNEINPDLALSIHYNSAPCVNDAGTPRETWSIRGFESRWCDDSGRLLAKIVSNEVTKELNRVERATLYQALAMLRHHRFPATLIEMSFIFTPDDYEFAQTDEYRRRAADGIANGIISWIDAQAQWAR
jgi:uncharacterized lipoprotein YddW (UPF0748 family)/N-acetylmuramoyl-L-alanine amidase